MNQKAIIRTKTCPIIEALIEVRFVPAVIPSAVFGMIYETIRDLYPNHAENLPILQLPETVREQDPNLKYRPLYKLENKQFILQVGPNVITISSQIPYNGWESFMAHVEEIVKRIAEKGVVKDVERLGHRYINFFEGNVFPKLNIEYSVCGNDCIELGSQLRTEFRDRNTDILHILQFVNNANINTNGRLLNGTLIDIDTIKDDITTSGFLQSPKNLLNDVHNAGKRLFFNLLKQELIDELIPIYE